MLPSVINSQQGLAGQMRNLDLDYNFLQRWKEVNCLGKKHLFLLMLFVLILAVLVSGCSLLGLPDLTPPDETGDPNDDPGGPDDEEPVPTYGTLVGEVYDAGFPEVKLQSGQVEIAGRVVPIKNGAYEVKNLPDGIYTMRVTKRWYKTVTCKVIVSGPTIQNIAMVPDISFTELERLAQLVRAEAQGESFTGQVAVAAVVLNRVLDHRYPNSIWDVIHEVTVVNGIKYYQFEPVKNGTINEPATDTSRRAVRNALAGWDPTKGAIGFFAHAKVPQWSGGKVPWVWEQWYKDPLKIRIGNHSFFR
jgi:hypothetical protein